MWPMQAKTLRACQKPMKSVSSHFAFLRIQTATEGLDGPFKIYSMESAGNQSWFFYHLFFLKCPQFLSLSGFDWVNKKFFPCTIVISPWDSSLLHWDSNSLILGSFEARLLGGHVTPLLDHRLFDLPGVALGPGAHLLGHIDALLGGDEPGHQLGDMLARSLGFDLAGLERVVHHYRLHLVVAFHCSLTVKMVACQFAPPVIVWGIGCVRLHFWIRTHGAHKAPWAPCSRRFQGCTSSQASSPGCISPPATGFVVRNINSGFMTDLVALWLSDIAHSDIPTLRHQLRPAACDVILHFVHLSKKII